jgi:hypothetical protein
MNMNARKACIIKSWCLVWKEMGDYVKELYICSKQKPGYNISQFVTNAEICLPYLACRPGQWFSSGVPRCLEKTNNKIVLCKIRPAFTVAKYYYALDTFLFCITKLCIKVFHMVEGRKPPLLGRLKGCN